VGGSEYEFVSPKVSLSMYRLEATLLLVAVLTPLIAWIGWRTGGALARSGSVTVFLAVLAEFLILNKANRKHLLNAARVRSGEMPWDFSKPAKVVGFISLVIAALGTLLWGFGDVLLGT